MNCQYCELDDAKCPGRGMCHCGCGKRTNLHPHTVVRKAIHAGDPCQYVQGHRHSKPHLKTPPLSMAEIKAMGG